MWNNLRITQRFLLVLCGCWLSGAAVIAVSYWGLSSARDSLKAVHEHAMALALQAAGVADLTVQNRLQVMLAFQHAPDNPLATLHGHPVQAHLDTIRDNRERVAQGIDTLLSASVSPREKELAEKLQKSRVDWVERLDQETAAITQENFSPSVMQAFLEAGRAQGEAMIAAAEEYRNEQIAQADQAYQAAEGRFRTGMLVFVLSTLLLSVPASLLGLLLMSRLLSGFRMANAAAAAIAARDLTQPVEAQGKDEIAAMLARMETMRRNLGQMIGQVRDGAQAIAGASTQVAAGTLDLSTRTEQQASALQQTASSTEELSSTVQQNADSAVQANELAAEATGVAQRGGQVVGQVVETMEGINASSRKIMDIISVIDGIAFQTNILALNAAVEAARAGEQGRGFAVVANEVRALAQRSAGAAHEVKDLITASVEKVGNGTEQVARAGATMQEIVTGIERVARIVSEIASASREQSAGLTQINQAVSHLDGVTQQNAALVEQTSAASSSLQEQARQLAGLAAQFRLQSAPPAGEDVPARRTAANPLPAQSLVHTVPRNARQTEREVAAVALN